MRTSRTPPTELPLKYTNLHTPARAHIRAVGSLTHGTVFGARGAKSIEVTRCATMQQSVVYPLPEKSVYTQYETPG